MKILLTLLTLLSLVVLAGCTATQAPVNTSTGITETVNTNDVAEVEETISNSNEAIDVAENTNSDETNTNDEIDTSDWLTYTNEEYGFSFRYPAIYNTTHQKIDGIDLINFSEGELSDVQIVIYPEPISEYNYSICNHESIGKEHWSNIEMEKFEISFNSEAGPECALPLVGYVFEKNGNTFHFKFNGDIVVSEQNQIILRTLQFSS